MAIVKMKEILEDAATRRYAVGCYNAYDLTLIRGILSAAEKEKSPVILSHAPVHFKYTALESVANLMLFEAERAKIPVAVLLDHGYEPETCIYAVDLGFNAVMMDASRLPPEQNAAAVKSVIEYCLPKGADVEAEIGYVTRPASGKGEGADDDSIIDDRSFYTTPEQAEAFLELTGPGVSALAVAFGTVHGLYRKKPRLDIDRLREISSAVPVPLVMHGGSGLSADDFRNAIDAGISKINYYTAMSAATGEYLGDYCSENKGELFYHNIMIEAVAAVERDISTSMRLFGSSGKA